MGTSRKRNHIATWLLVSSLGAVGTGVATAAEQGYASGVQHDDAVTVVSQQTLDSLLAPIALYPDSLLSHVLIASTYPLEVVKAARWRNAHKHLDEEEARQQVDDFDWSPSVKALVPFTDLVNRMADDLDWMQTLGEAFVLDEARVLASVQVLRRKARNHGNLASNEYIEVVEEDDHNVVIQPRRTEIIYVPVYDTHVVYGPWWHHHRPYRWRHSRYHGLHTNIYWGHGVSLYTGFHITGFHWLHRRTLISTHYRKPYRYHSRKIVRNREFSRHSANPWRHDPTHRRGVRFKHHGVHKPGRYERHRKHVTTQQRPAITGRQPVHSGKRTGNQPNKRPATVHSQIAQRLKKQPVESVSRVPERIKSRSVHATKDTTYSRKGQPRQTPVSHNRHAETATRRGQGVTISKPVRQVATRHKVKPGRQVVRAPSRPVAPKRSSNVSKDRVRKLH